MIDTLLNILAVIGLIIAIVIAITFLISLVIFIIALIGKFVSVIKDGKEKGGE